MMRIAGTYTDQQWMKLKKRLLSNQSECLWDLAFRRFYRIRIDTRYLYPIASIQEHDTQCGEGFAIAALFCSLIEFLESFEKGSNFHFIGKSKYVLQPHEYSERQASSYFKNFLTNRTPFNDLIPSNLVDSFYQDVRCGLLHEAQTKHGWRISTAPSSGALILQKDGKITLFRDQLIPALETYFRNYQSRLLVDLATQEAFIRKFDYLCQP